MRKFIIAFFAIIFLNGCQKEMNVNDSLQSDFDSKNITEKTLQIRPISVNFYATPNPAFGPVQCIPVQFGVFVGGGSFIHGTATHFGTINSENSITIVQDCMLGPLPNQLTTHQYGHIEAANGDLLNFSSADVISLLDGSFSSVVTMAGGTGRFMNATGNIPISGTVDFVTGIVTWAGTGTISY
jgi:hypothetical protein